MSTIKTTVKKITDRIKNYKAHVARPGRHGLPGMMNTGHGAAPQKGMGKSSPMKFDAFQSKDKQRETAMKESQENIENTSPNKQKVETPMAPKTTEKKKSEKIGPARSPKMMKELNRKRDDAAMNLKVSDEQAHKDQQEVGKEITEARKYQKK
jgi:hypothetical protein